MSFKDVWFCFVLFHFEEEAETASQTGNRHRKPAVRSAHAPTLNRAYFYSAFNVSLTYSAPSPELNHSYIC